MGGISEKMESIQATNNEMKRLLLEIRQRTSVGYPDQSSATVVQAGGGNEKLPSNLPLLPIAIGEKDLDSKKSFHLNEDACNEQINDEGNLESDRVCSEQRSNAQQVLDRMPPANSMVVLESNVQKIDLFCNLFCGNEVFEEMPLTRNRGAPLGDPPPPSTSLSKSLPPSTEIQIQEGYEAPHPQARRLRHLQPLPASRACHSYCRRHGRFSAHGFVLTYKMFEQMLIWFEVSSSNGVFDPGRAATSQFFKNSSDGDELDNCGQFGTSYIRDLLSFAMRIKPMDLDSCTCGLICIAHNLFDDTPQRDLKALIAFVIPDVVSYAERLVQKYVDEIYPRSLILFPTLSPSPLPSSPPSSLQPKKIGSSNSFSETSLFDRPIAIKLLRDGFSKFGSSLLIASMCLSSIFFARTAITHIPKGSPLLWAHFLFMVLVVVAHLGISKMEEKLRLTCFQDGEVAATNSSSSNSIAIFIIMVQGIPKSLAADRTPFEEYFQDRYPGKVYRVVVPFDLCSMEDLAAKWRKVQFDISWLEARLGARALNASEDAGAIDSAGENLNRMWWRWFQDLWVRLVEKLGFTDEERLRKLLNLRLVLETKLMDYKEGRASGAGSAFGVFKDVYTTNKAVNDFRTERKKRPVGQFFPLMELQLKQSRWRVERALPASDIYWSHLGLSKLSLRLRRVAVNTCLLVMLLFCSSPLALISAMKSAARIVNAEAMDSAQSWLHWLEGSSWLASVILQFLPNVLFVSMYIIIPSALSYLSKFEWHLTVSGEQRAAMLKMVCFFLVNLILLRALIESSLESAILGMKRCYLQGKNCRRIEQYTSTSFLSRSCLSTLAILIISSFLGISFDLLAPIPWIKKTLKKFRKTICYSWFPIRMRIVEEFSKINRKSDLLKAKRALVHWRRLLYSSMKQLVGI